jgi:thioredoxin 1
MATVKADPSEIEKLAAENKAVIVDFWAPWCPPCRAFGPLFEQLSREYTETLFLKVNVDDYPEFASANSISSIPTIWAFKDGEKIYDKPGTLNISQLKALLD